MTIRKLELQFVMPNVPRPNRLQVSMQVYVRGVDRHGVPFDISVDSKNVSRGGLMFTSEVAVAMDAQLDIVVERPPVGRREVPPLFTSGKVARVVPAKEGPGFDVSVEFTGPKLRMFSGETGV